MKNVYDQVRIFYEEETDWGVPVKKDWVEGFLRQKAWQGANDKELQMLWQNIERFLLYLAYAGMNDLDEVTLAEYSTGIVWLAEQMPAFKKNVANVRQYFAVLIEFYQYLKNKKVIFDLTLLEDAARVIAGGKKLDLTAAIEGSDTAALFDADVDQTLEKISSVITEDMSQKLNGVVERLMVKLGSYFHQENFNDDFDRALYLYTGPFEGVPDNDHDEFWLGFWDYFLFDYHLLQTDKTPLTYFFQNACDKLTSDEREILKNLLNAKFSVFYISKVLNQDWVECTNLFTDETFQLPIPNFDYKTLKRLLFFGHVFAQGMIMINYVTSIEVSPNLRKRIKEEILRQQQMLFVGQSSSDLNEFFSRHAQAVRHSIDVLVTLAKVNVINPEYLDREYPIIAGNSIPSNEVLKKIDQVAADYRFSAYDIRQMKKLWHDYCQVAKVVIRKSGTWAAALLYAYAQINHISHVIVEELARDLEVSASSVRSNRNKLFDALTLNRFDARYISEEGFMYLIFYPNT
ncbi:hypothetical protein SDC9_11255 [bioreactor metagenome]|uniref:Core-binding (CB) domain-containing protein n=1 Tax=bioreactor metagenome TaxID=1076179 RepID=A0A644TIP7_9ZZZZ|nr:hypothetical protein [Negativicutes bacterium]